VRCGSSYGLFDVVDVVDVSGPTSLFGFVTVGPEEGRSFFRNVVVLVFLVFYLRW
jgi:hypothetical protein